MNNQEISSLMEIFSFFFVTLDLYGKDRLNKTNQKLIGSTDWINEKIDSFRESKWSSGKNRYILYVLYVFAFVFTLVIFIIDPQESVFSTLFFFVITYVFVLLGVLLASAVIIALMLAISWLLKQSIMHMIRLLSFLNFEGLLLGFGSMLFLVSKYLEF